MFNEHSTSGKIQLSTARKQYFEKDRYLKVFIIKKNGMQLKYFEV